MRHPHFHLFIFLQWVVRFKNQQIALRGFKIPGVLALVAEAWAKTECSVSRSMRG